MRAGGSAPTPTSYLSPRRPLDRRRSESASWRSSDGHWSLCARLLGTSSAHTDAARQQKGGPPQSLGLNGKATERVMGLPACAPIEAYPRLCAAFGYCNRTVRQNQIRSPSARPPAAAAAPARRMRDSDFFCFQKGRSPPWTVDGAVVEPSDRQAPERKAGLAHSQLGARPRRALAAAHRPRPLSCWCRRQPQGSNDPDDRSSSHILGG